MEPSFGLEVSGSSPRVRGAGAACRQLQANGGIIPARAGSSHRRSRRTAPGRDHPRACGEQCIDAWAAECDAGSSPHARGAVIAVPFVCEQSGIIPARAGSSTSRASRMTCAWNHPACAGSRAGAFGSSAARRDQPRVCGKQFHLTDTGKALMGSSPRVRGGSTGRRCFRPQRRNHPRVCGEQDEVVRKLTSRKGSSPRVRGAG